MDRQEVQDRATRFLDDMLVARTLEEVWASPGAKAPPAGDTGAASGNAGGRRGGGGAGHRTAKRGQRRGGRGGARGARGRRGRRGAGPRAEAGAVDKEDGLTLTLTSAEREKLRLTNTTRAWSSGAKLLDRTHDWRAVGPARGLALTGEWMGTYVRPSWQVQRCWWSWCLARAAKMS